MTKIKISELSVGDWVMNLYANKPSRVIGLRTMFRDTYEIIAVSDDTQYMLIEDKKLHNYEPIPLTPEILEKNGFVDYGNEHYIYDDGKKHRVYISNWDKYWKFEHCVFEIGSVFNDMRCELLHTHQLQHALRSAGVEKEIEL